MLTFLATIFPTIAGWINLIIGYFQQKAADQKAANDAETVAEQQHQADGAQSVSDKESDDAQNAALDQIQQQLENPIPVVVTQPQGDKKP